MSQNNINSTNSILREYIQLLREQQTLQTNILNTYHQSLTNSNDILRVLLLRNFDRYSRNNREQNNSQSFFTPYRNNRPLNINRERNSQNYLPNVRIPFFSGRSGRQSPVTTNMYTPGQLRRRDNYSQRPIGRRSWQNPRNTTINNILLESFNAQPIPSNPTLTRERLSEITTQSVWRDISNNTNQGICPFTQEEFLPDTCVLTINSCGHIFTASHLERFFTRFGYRCPICRADQRNNQTTNTRQTRSMGFSRPRRPPPSNNSYISSIPNIFTTNTNTTNTNTTNTTNTNTTNTNTTNTNTNNTSSTTENDLTNINTNTENMQTIATNTLPNLTRDNSTSTTGSTGGTTSSVPDELTPLMESLFQTPEMNNIMNSVSNVLTNSFASALENQTFDTSGNGFVFDFQTTIFNDANNSTTLDFSNDFTDNNNNNSRATTPR